MAPLALEGTTLGQKHQHYNKLVNDASESKPELAKINYDESDVENLLKVDIACKNKNVDYVLEVLKCEDMLYVSRALKRCKWLITEQQYAHIINPQYLHTEMFPYMTTKAINKLILHIKLNLKDEKRVEDFYGYIKEHKGEESLRWLQNCSLEFIEDVLKSGTNIPVYVYKRLCRRSYSFFKYNSNVTNHRPAVLREVLFLINDHTDEYLDYLDTLDSYNVPNIDKKYTQILMKKIPNRILDNFEKYAKSIDLATVAKHLRKEEIKGFLLKNMNKKQLEHFMADYDNLKHFVKHMPKEDRQEFIKNVLIERTVVPKANNSSVPSELMFACTSRRDEMCCNSSTNSYRWYQYEPFNVAFTDLKKFIRTESSPTERCSMISVLVNACRKNPQHIYTVLQYYLDKHRNEPFKFKIQFVNNVLTKTSAHKFDNKTWHILDQLFHSMEVYSESDNDVQICVKAIIIHNVVNSLDVPEIVEKKFTFDTCASLQSQLSEEQKDKVFTYLLNHVTTKFKNEKMYSESDFQKSIDLLEGALKLLADWKKNLKDYIFVIEKIQQLISIKKEKSWKTQLSSLYNMNKKWRRQLFSESLALCPSEATCINALKHEPKLLARHSTELQTLYTNDASAPRDLLAKLRIYWPNTLAKECTDAYFERLIENSGHKAVITGLFSLLPNKQAIDVAKKYVPEQAQINWTETDHKQLSIRKNIAKCLHMTRPQPPVDVLLWYAKGDYLQYAVPSINAVLHNLSKAYSREHIEKLLDAPVSLQKFGIGLAFDKLESEELRPMFLKIWNTTKNSTIRAMLFTYTHKMLCKVKTTEDANDIWILLSTFIENLSNDENKIIYSKLGQVENIHSRVRGEYFMKSYTFLSSLPAKNNCESIVISFVNHAAKIMNLLDSEFVANILLANIDRKICKETFTLGDVISSFVLHGDTEEEQLKRFDKVLKPLMESAFEAWDTASNNEYIVKRHFRDLTSTIGWLFRVLIINKKIPVPVKLFGAIKTTFEESPLREEKYIESTYWKLTETYAKLVDEHKSMVQSEQDLSEENYMNDLIPFQADKIWQEMHKKISITLGPIYVQYLKEDVEKYFPSVYSVFGEALDMMCINLLTHNTSMKLDILMNMLGSPDFIPSYILVCERVPKYGYTKELEKLAQIRETLLYHTSKEVRMHFAKSFRDTPETEDDEINNYGY